MSISRFSKLIAGVVLTPILLLILAWLFIVLFQISLSLNFLKIALQQEVQQTFGRNLHIRGDINLIPQLRPTLEITDLALENPAGMEGKIFHAKRMYLELDFLALMRADLDIGELSASGLQIDLVVDEHGQSNWNFLDQSDEADRADEKPGVEHSDSQDSGSVFDVDDVNFNLGELRLEDISVSFNDHRRNTFFLMTIDQGLGSAKWNSALTFTLSGQSNDIPITLNLEATPVSNLFSQNKTWDGKVGMLFGAVDVTMEASLIARDGQTERQPGLALSIEGESLQDIEDVLDIPLPNWGPYHLRGMLDLTETGYSLKDLYVDIGRSNLSGDLNLELIGEHPKISMDLHSQLIDTEDFPLKDWDGFEYDSSDDSDEAVDKEEDSLLDSEILNSFSADFDVDFSEIKSGPDVLGSGRMNLTIGDGRLALEKFEAAVPGGVLEAGFSVVPGDETVEAKIHVNVKEFDYGILARRSDPESDMEGQLNLEVDIEGRSESLENLLASASGKIEIAVWPEKFESGVFDLWAVGLLSAAVSHYNDPSLVNCAVARFSLTDGIMKQDAILIDTSEIRVIGDGSINFENESFDFYLVPKAKKPAFISAAIPVGVKGTFDDFDLDIKSADVTKSLFRNTMNVVFLGLPLLFHKPLEIDGTAACREAMSRDIDLSIERK